MPGGDPVALEQLAAQLETAAAGVGRLAVSTHKVTTDVREASHWTGSAADAYTAFTGNLSTGVGTMQAPLVRIATAVRNYAGYLRAAQQSVSAYSSAYQTAAASKKPADVTAASTAATNAELAVGAQQRAGDQAAAEVRAATREMQNPFGPDGPVRSWIERIHAPWDSLAGDAAIARFLATAKSGEEMAGQSNAYIKGLAKSFKQQWGDLEGAVRANGGSEADVDEALLGLLDEFDRTNKFNTSWLEAAESLTKGANLVRGVAVGSDALGLLGDVFTEIKPEDGGTMGWVDRGVAGVNGVASGVDGTYAIIGMLNASADEIPVAGEVILIGSGLYLGGDHLYHHWTPFRDVANDVGHAAVSGVKDTWHAITSIF